MPNVSELEREEIENIVHEVRAARHAAAIGRPYVGMPATYVIGSDQYAGVLSWVSKTGHQVTWQRYDTAQQNHHLGFVKVCSRRRNGEYVQVGSKYGHLKLGVAKTILDEGF